MRKGILKIFTCLFLLIFGLGVFAACDTSAPSLEYRLDGKTYTVVGIGTYEDGELIIPETYKGKPVTAIGAEAFQGNKEIGLLEIPDSVTVIEENAFASCSRLEVVTMGNGVTSIGYKAFAFCDNLKAIRLSNTLKTIGDQAFYYCRKLQAISFPDSLETIGKKAFEGDTNREVHNSLTTVNFGTGLRTIGEYAFYNCANLSDVIIPDGAPTAIGNNAFLNCSRVRFIELGNGVVSIGENAFSADSLEEGGGLRVREVIIGDGVRTIGAGAFKNCRKLVTVTLGKGVQEIGNEAFYKCQVLREVINDSSLVITAGSSDYGYAAQYAWNVHTSEEGSKISHDEQGIVYYTDGARKVMVTAILTDSSEIVIPDDVTEIGEYACYNEQLLTGVVVGNGVTNIGARAFGNCYQLRTLKLGSSVTTIAELAFYNNVALSTVVFGTSVKTVGDGAFKKKEGWDGYRDYKMYYLGTKADWDQIVFGATNDHLLDPAKGGKIAFYSEEQPTDTKNLYWRYVNGTPKFWS